MLGMMMSVEAQGKLSKMLEQDEGMKQFPYRDTKGILSIGIGFNLESDGLYPEECQFILHNRMRLKEAELIKHYPYYKNLNDSDQIVLLNMAYCLGVDGLMQFRNMLGFLQAGNRESASKEIIDSQFGKDHEARAQRLAFIVERGTY